MQLSSQDPIVKTKQDLLQFHRNEVSPESYEQPASKQGTAAVTVNVAKVDCRPKWVINVAVKQ